MVLVLIVHADFFSLGAPTGQVLTSHPVSSTMRFVVQSLALVCVNVYVLISGYFGIKTRTRGVLNFIFMVFFWRILILCAYTVANNIYGIGSSVSRNQFIKLLVPGFDDWFVSAYILLMLLAPLLNAYVSMSSCRQLWTFAVIYIAFQFIFNWLTPFYEQFAEGYSVLSFIGLYILGAAVRKSSQTLGDSFDKCFGLYILLSVGTGVFMYFETAYFGDTYIGLMILKLFCAYNGCGIVIASLLLFLSFRHLKIQSSLINSVASSVFAVYLFHMHPLLRPYYCDACRYLFNHYNTWTYILLIALFICGVFVLSILIDKIRKRIWSILDPVVNVFVSRINRLID